PVRARGRLPAEFGPRPRGDRQGHGVLSPPDDRSRSHRASGSPEGAGRGKQIDKDDGDDPEGQQRSERSTGSRVRPFVYSISQVDEGHQRRDEGDPPRPRPHHQETSAGDAEGDADKEVENAVQNQFGSGNWRPWDQERKADEEGSDADEHHDDRGQADESTENRNADRTAHSTPPQRKEEQDGNLSGAKRRAQITPTGLCHSSTSPLLPDRALAHGHKNASSEPWERFAVGRSG